MLNSSVFLPCFVISWFFRKDIFFFFLVKLYHFLTGSNLKRSKYFLSLPFFPFFLHSFFSSSMVFFFASCFYFPLSSPIIAPLYFSYPSHAVEFFSFWLDDTSYSEPNGQKSPFDLSVKPKSTHPSQVAKKTSQNTEYKFASQISYRSPVW